MSTSQEKSETISTDSDDYFSADDDIKEESEDFKKGKSGKATSKRASPSQNKKSRISIPETDSSSSRNTTTTTTVNSSDSVFEESRPVPPPRRKKNKSFVKQSSLEEPTRSCVGSDINTRRTNTFSWPRGERPDVQYEEHSYNQSTDSTPVHKPKQYVGKESVPSSRHHHPSISIQPDESLQLTEELLENSEVESKDIINSKAIGSNTLERVTVYDQSDDESDQDRSDQRREPSEDEEYDDDEDVTDGGVSKQGTSSVVPPSDSQILEATYIKNLDTGEAFPLSLADMRIPHQVNPVDSLCDERVKASFGDSWDGGGGIHDIDSEGGGGGSGAGGSSERSGAGPTANQKKPRKKRFKKFFVKGKRKGDGRSKDMMTLSDEDGGSPEHGIHTVKYKAASHNKGKLDFEHVRLKQEFSHSLGNEMMAVWVLEFSICGRLLATAGQDSIVRVWVLRTAYHFFHELQMKYAKFGVHSSADSLSERSSVNSSMSSDPDDESTSLKPFLEQPLCTYAGHNADVLDLSWSKNFFLLSSSMDKTVRLWHISRKECLCCFQHVDFVTSVAFHPRDDRYFLSGSLDGKLRLWNIPDKKVALWNELEGVGSHLITAANFCMNGKLAVAGTYDGRCIFYETEHLKYHTQIHVRSRHGKNRGRKISGIEPLPGEDKILVTSNDSRLRLYNLKDHSLTCKYKGCLNSQSQIRATFSREGEYIICGSEDNYIYVWKTHHDFNKLSSVRRDRNDYYESFTGHSAPVTAVTFAPVPGITVDEGLRDIGEVIVAGDNKGNIKVYVTSEEL